MHHHAREPHQDGGLASAEYGTVLLDGPGGLAMAFTPDAAEQTGHSLIDAAKTARTQPPADPNEEPQPIGEN